MPVHGLDHMLITFAVGLIAAQIGGPALWAVPSTFSILLLLGGIANVLGMAVPFVDNAIFVSMIVLGAFLTYRRQLPLLCGLSIVAFFAMFHGVALVGEGPHNAWFFIFAGGGLGGFDWRNAYRTSSQEIKSRTHHPAYWMGDNNCRRINCHLPALERCVHAFFGVGTSSLPAES